MAAVLQDVKRIKVAETNKPGRLYPCLSDIETATETETETAANSPEPDTRCGTVTDWILFILCLA